LDDSNAFVWPFLLWLRRVPSTPSAHSTLSPVLSLQLSGFHTSLLPSKSSWIAVKFVIMNKN
jgi:hypothetical protein